MTGPHGQPQREQDLRNGDATVCISPNGRDISRGEGPADRLFVSSIDGVTRLERHKTGIWIVTGRSLRSVHVSALLYDARAQALFAGAHSGGLFVSFDHGESWEARTHGLTETHVFTLSAREEDDAFVLYAGTEPARLYRSDDLGVEWRELPTIRTVPGTERWTFPAPPHLGHVKHIAFHPTQKDTILVCVEQGALLRTTDGGASWSNLDVPAGQLFYKDCHRLRICRSNPDIIYMTGGDGLFRTEDGGTTWIQLTDATMRIGYPDALFLAPGDDQTLFMAGARSEPGLWPVQQAADACIMRSPDGGRSWSQITEGFPRMLHGNIEAVSMHVSESRFELFAGTTDGQIFALTDEGRCGRLVADGLPPVSKANHHLQLPQATSA